MKKNHPVPEELVLKLAVQKGHLRQSRLESLRLEMAAVKGTDKPVSSEWPIISHLLQNGELAWDTLEALMREVNEYRPDAPGGSRPAPPGISKNLTRKNQAGQRYRLEQFLGSGGMGEVYRAYDTQLQRYVALKRLKLDSPELRTRFFREARAQASVEHECICKIFDIGEQEGYLFIAMQYIAGKPLNQAAVEMILDEKVLLLIKVAEGLHAAHSRGLIHRDIKPENILVETTAEGLRKPYIMDFGLVRDLNRESLTAVEDFVGSLHYMSPEQVGGEVQRIDRRSDVFSLGVTLYELLTGQLPFFDTTLARVMQKILEKEPLPLRQINPAVPFDLETIVKKSLEKDPDRRYGSARELAEDLTRYCHGEPILAKRFGLGRRLIRKIKKHKAFSALVAAALFLLLLTVGMWLQARWRIRQQAEIASQFGRDVEEIESLMRYAHLVRPHNIEQDREMVQAKIASIEKRMSDLGKAAYGPGHYALGQGYLSLRDISQARKHLELAWNRGFRTDDVSYALGLALGEWYHLELAKAERISNRELQAAVIKRLENLYIKPALLRLNTAKPGRGIPPAYAQALIAFYEQRYADALRTIGDQAKSGDRFYEMRILEGNIRQAMGDQHWLHGDFDATMREYERAAEAYQVATEIGRSDASGYLQLGQLYEKMAAIQISSKGQNVQTLLAKAAQDCGQALLIDPKQMEAYTTKSAVLMDLGKQASLQGQDPYSYLDQALASAKKAMANNPEDPYSYYIAGQIYIRKGEYEVRHGDSPIGSIQQAIAFFQKALAMNPNDISARLDMALALMNMAYHQILHGIPADENIDRAVGSSLQAVQSFPGLAHAHRILGMAYQYKALLEFYRGGDARQAIMQAVKSYRQAMALNPHIAQYYCNCGIALLGKATDETAAGLDPQPTFAEAMHLLEKARQINPNLPNVYNGIGFIQCEKANYQLLHGGDADESLQQASFYLQKARDLSPNNIETFRYLIIIERIKTRRALWLNQPPEPFAAAAEKNFREGLKINSSFDDLFNEYAAVLLTKARFQLNRGLPVAPVLLESRRLLERAMAVKGDSFVSHRLRGELELLEARNRMTPGRNPELFFKEAENWLERSLRLNPRRADTYLTLAETNYWKSEWQRQQKKEYRTAIDQGLIAADRALALNPECAEAYVLKGLLLRTRASLAENRENKEKELQMSDAALKTACRINSYLKAPSGLYPY